jgi:hypothetical protein
MMRSEPFSRAPQDSLALLILEASSERTLSWL